LKGHGKGKYRDYMTKHGVLWNEDMPVFLSIEQPHEPLKYQAVGNAILRISKSARVGFGAHDGRRIVETALENVGTPRNWIQKIKGRKVRGEDSPYSKPAIEQLRKKYREALPELEFLNVVSKEDTEHMIEKRVRAKIAEISKQEHDELTKLKAQVQEMTDEIASIRELGERLVDAENQLFLDREMFEKELGLDGVDDKQERKESQKQAKGKTQA
jgi:hypothetical protein